MPICGDGLVMKEEVCDDKNSGGCTQDCKGSNSGYICTSGSTLSPSICVKKNMTSQTLQT